MDQTYKGKVYIFIRERKHLEYTDEAGTPWCVCTNTGIINMESLPPYIRELYLQEEYIINLLINSHDQPFCNLLCEYFNNKYKEFELEYYKYPTLGKSWSKA